MSNLVMLADHEAEQMNGGWGVRWRLRLFFMLVKLQARFPVVKRLAIE